MKKEMNVLEILQDIQTKHGYLPKKELIKLSKNKKIPGVEIYSVASFYSQFKLEKPAKYKIAICRGTACHIKHSDNLLVFIEDMLGIKSGEKTTDEKFSLDVVNCIGACAKAPAIMINGTVYGELNKKKLKKIIEDLK